MDLSVNPLSLPLPLMVLPLCLPPFSRSPVIPLTSSHLRSLAAACLVGFARRVAADATRNHMWRICLI